VKTQPIFYMALLTAMFILMGGCTDDPPGDDDDTSVGDDDDTSVGDDDDSSAGDDDTSTGDDDSSTGDDDTSTGDDDSSEPPLAVQTPAAHQICAAAGTTSADGLTMTSCFGPRNMGQGTTSDGTLTLHAGALRQIAP
jgi:hypothetical protein